MNREIARDSVADARRREAARTAVPPSTLLACDPRAPPGCSLDLACRAAGRLHPQALAALHTAFRLFDSGGSGEVAHDDLELVFVALERYMDSAELEQLLQVRTAGGGVAVGR